MKIWLLFLIISDNGVSQRVTLEFKTKVKCEVLAKKILRNKENNITYAYCIEVLSRRSK